MPAQQVIYFADVFFMYLYLYFFNCRPRSKEISGTTEWIITKFSGLVDLLEGLVNLAFIWQSLKGHCHGNQLNFQNWHYLRTNLSCRAAF